MENEKDIKCILSKLSLNFHVKIFYHYVDNSGGKSGENFSHADCQNMTSLSITASIIFGSAKIPCTSIMDLHCMCERKLIGLIMCVNSSVRKLYDIESVLNIQHTGELDSSVQVQQWLWKELQQWQIEVIVGSHSINKYCIVGIIVIARISCHSY